ncbi:hypothetical protein SBA3_240023 [Candidatus Sulfopaludibacter sp. SbA3]|nr:hypothetical protein SBA3_240023 [Candidatus Sulfopaludibacter sp. SbA3]
MVLRKNGTQEKDVEMPLNGMWRMIQDSSAAFIFLVPNGRRDGLIVYGPSADGLELGVPREFDLKGNRVDYHRARVFRWRMWWTAPFARPMRSGSISESSFDEPILTLMLKQRPLPGSPPARAPEPFLPRFTAHPSPTSNPQPLRFFRPYFTQEKLPA